MASWDFNRRYPAPGFRDAGYYKGFGAFCGVGNNGFNWSSSTSGIYSPGLNFYMIYLTPGSALHRAHGFQLRCLSE
ncbi:hypothetical protein [uncultured Rikenella sp.]|uniref:hypothetical protein n=1 Tax=uncultured Rikenella sp. TaxID=368003 RepID=UPI00263408E6|nr:hypothetical protein [uncultured Rikenella sp.]